MNFENLKFLDVKSKCKGIDNSVIEPCNPKILSDVLNDMGLKTKRKPTYIIYYPKNKK